MADDGPTTLTVFGVPVTLASSPGVFVPTTHGLFYAGAARVRPGERVIDIGTGSGLLAIAAARAGAREVVATDIDARAVEAARRNAARNGVALEARVGPLFAGATGTFDVVLANLPNEIVAPAHLATLSDEEARTFAGGPAGNDALLALLDAAPAHMHAGSRLYLGVHALTDYHATLRAALARYEVRLLALAPLAVKPYVTAHLDHYRALDAAGVVRLFRDAEGRWSSWGYVYELTLPGAPGA
jgi:methylase of polypeptide subunit release factors